YLLCLSPNLSVAHDSIGYLSALASGPLNGSGHHLLQHISTFAWVKFWQSLGFSNITLIVSSLNALSGACLVALVYRFANEGLQVSTSISLAASLCAGLSYGIWVYSIVLEVYMLPLCLLVASIWRLSSDHPQAWQQALALHVLATLFHQMHILWLLVVIPYLFLQKGPWLRYGLIWGGSVAGIYLLFMWGVMGFRSYTEMQGFVLGMTQESHFWGMGGAPGILIGNARAWIGGHFVFAQTGAAFGLQLSFANADDQYLVRNLTHPAKLVCIVTSLLAAVSLLRLVWGTLRRFWRSAATERIYPLLLIGGILVYSLFFVFWVPINPEFWMLQLVLWCLLFAWGIRSSTWLWILAACLGLANWLGSVQWLQSQEHDLYYQKAQYWQQTAQEDELILVYDGWTQESYAAYFTNKPLMVLESCGPDSIRNVIRQHDQLLLEKSVGRVLAADSSLWDRQRLDSPFGPYERWRRREAFGEAGN
ncbi:MAG: hypothetical protein AAFQ87_26665, partial [Bacteroidota bacterium]